MANGQGLRGRPLTAEEQEIRDARIAQEQLAKEAQAAEEERQATLVDRQPTRGGGGGPGLSDRTPEPRGPEPPETRAERIDRLTRSAGGPFGRNAQDELAAIQLGEAIEGRRLDTQTNRVALEQTREAIGERNYNRILRDVMTPGKERGAIAALHSDEYLRRRVVGEDGVLTMQPVTQEMVDAAGASRPVPTLGGAGAGPRPEVAVGGQDVGSLPGGAQVGDILHIGVEQERTPDPRTGELGPVGAPTPTVIGITKADEVQRRIASLSAPEETQVLKQGDLLVGEQSGGERARGLPPASPAPTPKKLQFGPAGSGRAIIFNPNDGSYETFAIPTVAGSSIDESKANSLMFANVTTHAGAKADMNKLGIFQGFETPEGEDSNLWGYWLPQAYNLAIALRDAGGKSTTNAELIAGRIADNAIRSKAPPGGIEDFLKSSDANPADQRRIAAFMQKLRQSTGVPSVFDARSDPRSQLDRFNQDAAGSGLSPQ